MWNKRWGQGNGENRADRRSTGAGKVRRPVKILIYSRTFNPAIGGMEKLQEVLAGEFQRQGHGVEVITETPGAADLPYRVHRQPGSLQFWRIARRADVILTAPLSLKRLLPQALSLRPILVAQPDAMLGGKGLAQGLFAWLKRRVVGRVISIVPSRYLAQYYRRSVVIANPYDPAVFHWPKDAGAPRRDILFAGRIVRWKGVHVLVEAFARIAVARPEVRLTIAGDGAQRGEVEAQVAALGLGERVTFTGIVRGEALGDLMRRHAVMVVPSVNEEPFGIVALEGLACGCRMVVSEFGGLPEAVGDQALLFPPGHAGALAKRLGEALDAPVPERVEVEGYLARFAPARVAGQYLEVFAGRCGKLW